MKKETKEKIILEAGEITWTIIGVIARIPEALLGSFTDAKSIGNNIPQSHEFLADRLIDHLRNLKNSGYIELRKTDSNFSVKLTTKGKIKNLESPTNLESDGRVRIISYDIPETIAKKRHQFCRSLRRIGYRKLQKSLWVCKYNKADEIDLIIDELDIGDYVSYFIAETSNVDRHIAKILG